MNSKTIKVFLLISWATACAFGQTFQKITTGIVPLTHAFAKAVDFNSDGLLDIFVSGITANGLPKTTIYFNSGNNTFNALALTAFTDAAFDFADYNNDGLMDIFAIGVDGGGKKRTILFRNVNGVGFALLDGLFEEMSNGAVLARDVDSDGDVDVVFTGVANYGASKTIVYQNKSGVFTKVETAIDDVSNGRCLMFDANSDGVSELLITGITNTGDASSKIYSISKDLEMSLYGEVSGFAFNDIALSDFDSDGLSDFTITGLQAPAFERGNLWFANSIAGNFVSHQFDGVTALSASSVSAVDLDNDGHSDLILTGQDENDVKYTYYLRNTGLGDFAPLPTAMTPIYDGSCALADLDDDGDIDIIQVGHGDVDLQANVYLSNQSVSAPNQPPSVPTDLEAVVAHAQVTFTWAKSNDDNTPQSSLTYNLYLSKTPGGKDFFLSPLANVMTGKLLIPTDGNAGHLNYKTVVRLPEGKYYWAVQSIDNSFSPSSFSPEQSFTICYGDLFPSSRRLCKGDTLELSAGSVEDAVNWSSLENGAVATGNAIIRKVETSETIVAHVNRSFGCVVRDTIKIEALDPPHVELGTDDRVCSQQAFTKTIQGVYDSVRWFRNGALIGVNVLNISFRAELDYQLSVVVWDSDGCRNTDTLQVEVNPLPNVSLGDDLSVCERTPVNVELGGQWASVEWSDLVSENRQHGGAVFSFEALKDHLVVAQVVDANGCINSDTLRVNKLSPPVADAGGPIAICRGDEVKVVAAHAKNEQAVWMTLDRTPVASGDALTKRMYNSEVFLLKVTDENGCVNIDTLNVSMLPLPTFSLGPDTARCNGEKILFKAPAGMQRVDWFVEDTLSKPASWFLDYEVNATVTIVSKVKDTNGCFFSDTIKVVMLPLPNYSLGKDLRVCAGDSISLSIPGLWREVNWYLDDETQIARNASSIRLRMIDDLSIKSEVITDHGCVSRDTITVYVNTLPVFDLGDDQEVCVGDSIFVEPSIRASRYNWIDLADGRPLSDSSNLVLIGTKTLQASLHVVDENHCAFSDTISLVVNPLPVITLEGDSTICFGSSSTMRVTTSNWQTISWHLNRFELPGDASITFSPLSSDTLSVEVVDNRGCRSEKRKLIRVIPLPQFHLMKDTLLCYGEQVELTGLLPDDLVGFEWSQQVAIEDRHVKSPRVMPFESTTYILTVLDQNGCHSTDSVRVEVDPKIVVDAGADLAVCSGKTVTLGGTPPAAGSIFSYKYSWSAAASPFQSHLPNPTVVAQESETYYLFVTAGRCSVALDSVKVSVYNAPSVTLSPTQSIGFEGTAQLFAKGGVQYIWSPPESLDDFSSPNPIASPSRSTVYHVRVVDAYGCEAESETLVLVQNTLFVPNLFSPNNDSMNDCFRLYGSGVQQIRLSIFDFEGNRVFFCDDKNKIFFEGWDGKFEGKPLKEDSYFWAVEGTFADGLRLVTTARSKD